MKITKLQLKQIIKEELNIALNEYVTDDREAQKVLNSLNYQHRKALEQMMDLLQIPPERFDELLKNPRKLGEFLELLHHASKVEVAEGKKKRKKYEYDEPTHVRGYVRHDKSGKKTYVEPHGSEAEVIAREYEPEEEEKELEEKKYKTSPGAAASLKKHGGSCKKAVDAGKFDWADEPYAVCNATKIVTKGEPTVPRGSKFTKGSGPDGKGRKLIEK